jgi:hypothetical protein
LAKTPYYIGQYSLEISLDRLLPISLEVINRWLLPLLAATSLPVAIRTFLEKREIDKKNSFLAAAITLPFFAFLFISTTPQNLAYLFLLLTILYLLSGYRWLPWILAIAAMSIHPISGLPALASCGLFLIFKQKKPRRNWLAIAMPLVSTILIFFAFVISGAKINWMGARNISNLYEFSSLFPNQENAWLDSVYFFLNNAWITIILILALAIYTGIKKKQSWLWVTIIAALSSFLPAIACALFLSFDSLIAYEQQDYVLRLLLGTWIIIIPVISYGLAEFSKKISQTKNKGALIAISLILAIALYGSYPRLDNFHNSRGYSLSGSDIEAVHLIEESAQGNKYFALSNQQSGVGALKEFGFGRYIEDRNGNQIYFYSIPTGGKMYQYYLDMVYKTPDRQTMEAAMDETGTNLSYLLVSRYWWASDKIISEAKLVADEYFQTNDGQISIFKFHR